MEYKWNILINQRAAVELGLELDIIDLAIFDYIKGFVLSNKCMKVNTEDGTFYWVSHKNIKDAMPLLNIKSDQGIINRIKNLIDAGLLVKYSRCEEFGKTLYTFGPTYDRLEYFETPQQKLRVPQTKVETNILLKNNTSSLFPLEENNSSPTESLVDHVFEEFWNRYDKKVQRAQAERMWKKLKKTEIEAIMSRVDAYVQSTPDRQFRMNPATYINPSNRRWEDEIRQPDEKPADNHVWKC